MSGEVMTTSIGLGQTLMTGRNLADINQVMLVMVVIVVVGILIDQVVFYNVEKRVLKKRGLCFGWILWSKSGGFVCLFSQLRKLVFRNL